MRAGGGEVYKAVGPACIVPGAVFDWGFQQVSTGIKEQERNQPYSVLNRTKVCIFSHVIEIIGPLVRVSCSPVGENN